MTTLLKGFFFFFLFLSPFLSFRPWSSIHDPHAGVVHFIPLLLPRDTLYHHFAKLAAVIITPQTHTSTPPVVFPAFCIGRHFHLTFSRVVGSRCKGFSSSSPHGGKRSRLPRTLVVTKKSMHKKKSYATSFSYSGLARQLQTLASQVSGGLGITVFARRNVASFGAVAL